MTTPARIGIRALAAAALFAALPGLAGADTAAAPESAPASAAVFAAPQRDGAHDFDFLIGDWKAHVRGCPID